MCIRKKSDVNNQHEYKLNGRPLGHSTKEKDLGIIIDEHLSFEDHMKSKINKANSISGLIRRTMTHLDKASFKLLFTTLVRPHLEYGNAVWSPHLRKHVEAIENVQRRATKWVPGLKDLSYECRLKSLNLPTLAYRRYRGDMIEIFKLTHDMYDNQVTTGFLGMRHSSSRGHSFKIYKPGCSTDLRKYSFKQRIVDQWNMLPAKVVEADTIITFEHRLDKFWKNSDIMFNPDTNILDITNMKQIRSAHPPTVDHVDYHDLRQEAI